MSFSSPHCSAALSETIHKVKVALDRMKASSYQIMMSVSERMIKPALYFSPPILLFGFLDYNLQTFNSHGFFVGSNGPPNTSPRLLSWKLAEQNLLISCCYSSPSQVWRKIRLGIEKSGSQVSFYNFPHAVRQRDMRRAGLNRDHWEQCRHEHQQQACIRSTTQL